MRLNDRTWRPELPKAPLPGWAWGLTLVLVAGAIVGYAAMMLLAR